MSIRVVDPWAPYDGSLDIDMWKLLRKRALKMAEAERSNMLTHVDRDGKPLYKLTEGGNFARTKPMSAGTRARVIARDGALCVWCGSAGPFEVDHIIRYVDGGSNDPSNLQTLCEPCHRSKGGR